MLNYIVNTSQDDSEPKAAQHLIEELIKAFPEEPARKTIMTFAQQLKEEYKQEFMGTLAQQLKQEGLQQGLQQGRQEVLALVRNLLKQNVPLATIKSASGLSEQELLELEDV